MNDFSLFVARSKEVPDLIRDAIQNAGGLCAERWIMADGGALQYRAAWVAELGLEFNLRMDGFAWALAALVTGIGFLVVLYARYYMSAA